MRPRSLVGPLILVVIGVFFLINNLRPEISIFELFGRYWPILVIVWGAMRLLEILTWAAQRKPLPRGGVSGGEWVAVVFLCIFGTGVMVVGRGISSWPPDRFRMRGIEMFGEAFDYTLAEQKLATSKTPRVVIENFRGNARITGGDFTEVKVSGRKTVRSLQQEHAIEANTATPLELIDHNGVILIRTNHERAKEERFISADLEISVPRGATIEARGRAGDFDVTSVDGDVIVTSDNAGVRLQSIKGNVRIDTRRSDIIRAADVTGSIELKGGGHDVELDTVLGAVVIDGIYVGELQFRNLAKPVRYQSNQTDFRVERCPGEIRLSRGHLTADNIIGPIVINARSKDIQISNFSESIELTLDRGDIELRPGRVPMPKMDVRTRAGNIDLALPDNGRFQLRATVHKGEIHNDYGEPLNEESEGRTATLQGKVGDGPQIVLTSDRGSLTVRKSGVLSPPMAPEPPLAPKPPLSKTSPIEVERSMQ